MARIPSRTFMKVAAAFHEVAQAANRPCVSESSGDGSSRDLFDVVPSFMEIEGFDFLPPDNTNTVSLNWTTSKESDSSSYCLDRLRNLLGFCNSDDDDIEQGRQRIQSVVEDGLLMIGQDGSEMKLGFKRQLVAYLRDRGFDAGLCKSSWKKSSKFPAGDYQYMDVKFGDHRFIVELYLSGNFQIARPSIRYAALVDLFPRVFVGTPDEVKQVVRLMCNAMKESMRSTDLLLPPWRRNGYMQAKWLGSYKRTTIVKKQDSERKSLEEGGGCLPELCYHCQDKFATKNKLRSGYLTAAFSDN